MTLQELLRRRLRTAATFIVLGVLIQGLTLLWHHPAAFLFFVLVGGVLVLLGVTIFLAAVLHPRPWSWAYRLLRQAPPQITPE